MSRTQRQYTCILIVFLVYILLLTFSPYDFSVSHYSAREAQKVLTFRRLLHFHMWDMVLNVLVFMPFGFVIRKLMIRNRKTTAVWTAVLISAVLSIGIESTQLFLSRHTALSDVITNTLGGGLGALLGPLLSREKSLRAFPVLRSKWIHRFVLVIYGVFICLMIRIPIQNNQNYHWNHNYPLCIGNEATQDRPWKGEMHFIGIYDYAFSQMQAKNHYRTHMGIQQRPLLIDKHNLALYTFFEGTGDTVHNLASSGRKLNLIGDKVQWLRHTSGIVLNGRGLKSSKKTARIVQAVAASGEFSIALVITPADTVQQGPARIVSHSVNPQARNFMAGQIGPDLVFRVRTWQAGANGSHIQLHASDVLTPEKTHVVCTFNRGVSRLFVNGEIQSVSTSILKDYLPDALNLGLTSFGYFASVFLIWFPLFILIYFFLFRGQWLHFFIACVVAGFIPNVVLHEWLGEPVHLMYMVWIALTAGLCGLYAWVYDIKKQPA